MSKKVSSAYLSVRAEELLAEFHGSSESCFGYKWLNDGKSPQNVSAIKELKQHGMIEFHRGLMTEEGQVAGSGWCRSKAGNEYVMEHEL